MSFAEILESEFRDARLDVSTQAQKQLAIYARELEHWNKTVNLTALRDVALVRRLIVEPIWAGQYLQMSGVLADVGSGNGSPGIPLGLTRNFSAIQLVEPRIRRAAFLRHIVSKLAVAGITVNRNRIEDVPSRTFQADWITLQAIEPTVALMESLRGIASITTRVVWITSIRTPPTTDAAKVGIPNSTTLLWVFRLDQT